MSLRALEPLYSKLPEITTPPAKPPLKKRLFWTGLVLVLFFIMGHIPPYGLIEGISDPNLAFLQIFLASNIGSIISAGIGPIVVASIVLQLIVGAGIIHVNMADPLERRAFTGTQKLLTILFSIFEGFLYTNSYLRAVPGMEWIVALQVAFGSILLMYMDEIVMKWGLGSGISLFIAGNVSKGILWRGFAPHEKSELLKLVSYLSTGNPLWIVSAFTFLSTLVVFFLVVYAEGIQVDIPITWARARGVGGRYPVKLLYLSNIPVILAVALFANIQLWAFMAKDTPLSIVLGQYENEGGRWVLKGGLAYFLRPPYELLTNIVSSVILRQPYPSLPFDMLHGFIYIVLLTGASTFFGHLWLELSGSGPKQIAEQLIRSGFSIPGFRRDKRIIEDVLARYIPTVAILGSAFVGFLAAFTDVFGALSSGTGILLAVTIMYRYYELVMREKLLEEYPALEKVMA